LRGFLTQPKVPLPHPAQRTPQHGETRQYELLRITGRPQRVVADPTPNIVANTSSGGSA
jgi:hypothetical protein